MRYIAITLLLGLLVVILAPYAQRLFDAAKKRITKAYDDYNREVDNNE